METRTIPCDVDLGSDNCKGAFSQFFIIGPEFLAHHLEAGDRVVSSPL